MAPLPALRNVRRVGFISASFCIEAPATLYRGASRYLRLETRQPVVKRRVLQIHEFLSWFRRNWPDSPRCADLNEFPAAVYCTDGSDVWQSLQPAVFTR